MAGAFAASGLRRKYTGTDVAISETTSNVMVAITSPSTGEPSFRSMPVIHTSPWLGMSSFGVVGSNVMVFIMKLFRKPLNSPLTALIFVVSYASITSTMQIFETALVLTSNVNVSPALTPMASTVSTV